MDEREADEYQPHTLTGFPKGHWEGATLVVKTTHLIGELARNTEAWNDDT